MSNQAWWAVDIVIVTCCLVVLLWACSWGRWWEDWRRKK